MKRYINYTTIPITMAVFFTSCSTFEKASTHGFKSGYYKIRTDQKNVQNVYVDITDEKIDVYHETKKQPDKNKFLSISLQPSDGFVIPPVVFRKNSLDIDITAILLKYRPAVFGLPGQLTSDVGIALN